MDCSPPGSSVLGDSPGKNTGVGCHALLQGIFPTQGSTQVSLIASRLFTVWATREAWNKNKNPIDKTHTKIQYEKQITVDFCCRKERYCYYCCWVPSVVSDSVRPHPWDSPGKNTGVGCHFLLQCIKVKSESEVTQPCLTLCDPMDCSLPGSSVHGIFQARVLECGAIAFSKKER